jgi:hypothetical protein
MHIDEQTYQPISTVIFKESIDEVKKLTKDNPDKPFSNSTNQKNLS